MKLTQNSLYSSKCSAKDKCAEMNQLFQTHHKVCLNMVLYDKIENYALGLFVAVASDISTRSSMRVFRQNYSRPTIEFGR